MYQVMYQDLTPRESHARAGGTSKMRLVLLMETDS